MAKSAIEKFISNYLRNKKISESKDGYAEWLRKNRIDPLANLSDEVGAAYSDSEKEASDYSATAEALADSGLSQSGYAKYLGEKVEGRKESNLQNAIQQYLKTDSNNKSDYSSELERLEQIRVSEEEKAEAERVKAEEKANKEALEAAKKLAEQAAKEEAESLKKQEKAKADLLKKAKTALESSSIIDYDKAYEYALNMGVEEADAEELAKSTTEAARSSAISKVTNAIISKRLTMNQTKEYALALGLSEEDSTLLAELAFRTNESVGDIVSQEDYLDYLREQANKNK